ncbi:MAG: Cd(II)/Pb(II)-responsive transcriptional regulator [Candidatus Thiodiazotropha sp. (ex Lucina aurantia)]|nr:Cd(II)/Pb(II)-responsive transcriptional regulator [Candidatus Thiodiazotropha sp. (ex Lucina pensylvanica)]MBT3024406.1 Cd(II)/Pb(II)-responsive transcriptional regulator [Candidatus Thiodiazotropha taylori]MBT3052263.1 Cd(II)/Pb(II)-responsive transcriptional regulator [Candidatus Thiodiazotropha sp. (ex Codakia orbicularis)]MBV2104050.1 Cd(II)/Pb(II)-responsive transcriptional regulator [Candidatus Thiodiazotropha sp. (ex Lucina aurantia)]MBT3032747.1 Cd(II)/Pb(II)-responsive transcriptio
MRIGELAKRAAMKTDTVRYYEKTGLLPPPPRRQNGYRDYGTRHLERLAFIRHCRALDMSLADISRLLEFVTHPDVKCDAIDRLIEGQLIQVQARISSLRTLESQLLVLRDQCHDQKTAGECGILQELVAAAHDGGCVCHPASIGETATDNYASIPKDDHD